jgi:hypothetical protein
MGKAGYKPMLATHSVEDMGSALVVLRTAMNSRQTKAHKMNQRSSRSHMVVFLQVHAAQNNGTRNNNKQSSYYASRNNKKKIALGCRVVDGTKKPG